MRLLASILRLWTLLLVTWNSVILLDPVKTNLLTVVNERQRSLAISLKYGDFSHRPNLLNEQTLSF